MKSNVKQVLARRKAERFARLQAANTKWCKAVDKMTKRNNDIAN